jgi:hypothetical protein
MKHLTWFPTTDFYNKAGDTCSFTLKGRNLIQQMPQPPLPLGSWQRMYDDHPLLHRYYTDQIMWTEQEQAEHGTAFPRYNMVIVQPLDEVLREDACPRFLSEEAWSFRQRWAAYHRSSPGLTRGFDLAAFFSPAAPPRDEF